MARNAELNPPALGAAGAASSFLAGSSFLAASAAPGNVNAGALPAVAPPKLNADEAAVVVDPKRGFTSSFFSSSFFSSSFFSSFFSVEVAVAPNEKPLVVLDVEEAAPPKLNPPEDDAAEAESSFYTAAVDAVPKPNDAADEAGAAPPKLKPPVAAAPALGAAGSAVASFPSALSRSS